MRQSFRPRLVHPPFGDPGVLVELGWSARSVLLDLPPLGPLSARDRFKAGLVLVSHAHLDHFSGFDELLRAHFGEDETLTLLGPPGIGERVGGKLGGYTWNLVAGNPFVIEAVDVGEHELRPTRFRAVTGFAPEPLPARPHQEVVHEEPRMRVLAAALDHHIVSMAWALEEPRTLHVDVARLAELGLATGPWLTRLKELARAGAPGETEMEAERAGGGRRTLTLAEASSALREGEPEKLAYVTDAAPSDENAERIVALARGATVFFCEAPFLERDAERARETRHLTARRAGELARRAGARRLVPFHFSRRYQPDPEPLLAEAREGFGGEVG